MFNFLYCLLAFISFQNKHLCHKYTFEESYNARSEWCNSTWHKDLNGDLKILDYQYCMSPLNGFEPKSK